MQGIITPWTLHTYVHTYCRPRSRFRTNDTKRAPPTRPGTASRDGDNQNRPLFAPQLPTPRVTTRDTQCWDACQAVAYACTCFYFCPSTLPCPMSSYTKEEATRRFPGSCRSPPLLRHAFPRSPPPPDYILFLDRHPTLAVTPEHLATYDRLFAGLHRTRPSITLSCPPPSRPSVDYTRC